MMTTLKILVILFAACVGTHAQVAPAATRPGLPVAVSGSLHYGLRYSQSADFYSGSQDDRQTSNLSGDVGYVNDSTRLPFNLTYGGGYSWVLSGPSYNTGFFQHLMISQGIVMRHWNVLVSDNVSFTPQAPTTGFSGVPGTGDLNGGTSTGTPSSQTILTVNTRSISNSAQGSIGHNLNHATSMSLGGGSELLRYPDGNGLDTNSLTANAGLNRRLNARNSLSGQYMFSQYSYGGTNLTVRSNSAMAGFNRTWNRKLNTSLSAGPQWIGYSDSTLAPSSMSMSASAAIDYKFTFGSAGLSYSRGTSGGSGYMLGAKSDNVSAHFSREFGRNLSAGVTGSYMRTVALSSIQIINGQIVIGQLNTTGVSNAKYGGAQVNRRLGRYMNIFASYTAIDQSSSLRINQLGNSNILSGMNQVFAFGIGYSPREKRLKQ